MGEGPAPLSTPASPAAAGLWLARQPVLAAVGAGLVAFALGTGLEALIIRAVHGNRRELEWISDILLSLAVAGLSFLWLHLRVSRARLLELERQRVALDEQLRLAAEIQRNLLPQIPERTRGYRWAARIVPAGHVGGDFYDFVPLAGDRVLAILGDVSGKGIPAALVQASLKTLFRVAARASSDPLEVAESLSEALYEQASGVPYATAIVARFEAAPARLRLVNAGHPAAVLLAGTASRLVEASGPPLGLLPGARYAALDLALQPGELGLFVSDGVTEALEGVPATVAELLLARVAAGGDPGSPAEVCDVVLRAAEAGPGPLGVTGWQDDRTVLAFRAEGPA